MRDSDNAQLPFDTPQEEDHVTPRATPEEEETVIPKKKSQKNKNKINQIGICLDPTEYVDD